MFAAIARKNLTTIADAYGKATGYSQSEISKRFYGRWSFFAEFRRGKQSISIDKLDEILARFRKEWPEDTEWPTLPIIRMTQIDS